MDILIRVIITIGVLLLFLLILVVSMALVLGFAMGIGWLLTFFLPFDLFQASLLALITAAITLAFWRNFLLSLLGFGDEDEYEEDDSDYYEEDDYRQIPETRFYKRNSDKTWEAWLRHHIANCIYMEFQDSPQPVTPMGDKQQQELAIRLADLTVSFLKAKSARTKELKISIAALKRQMGKIGQRPYDDDILQLATLAINDELNYHYDEVIAVIRSKLWKQPHGTL